MKISNREKVLLGILAAIALLAISYYVIFKPQLEKIDKFTQESAELKLQVQKTETEIASIPLLETMITELEKSLEEKTEKFYPEILQDRIIIIIDDLIKKAQVDSPSSAYSQIAIAQIQKTSIFQPKKFPAKELVDEYIASKGGQDQEKPEGNSQAADQTKSSGKAAGTEAQPADVQSISVTLQFEGSYDQAIRLIKEVEALKRTIVIPDLALVYGAENNLLTGSIRINFYALPKISVQDGKYLEWPYNNKYGKTNPFIK
ncbi:MAG: hypothetical protein FIA99_01840 [Ruminiclostridium sp.]|nr:hypothetical protein [Ruminiclostridium sp.]